MALKMRLFGLLAAQVAMVAAQSGSSSSSVTAAASAPGATTFVVPTAFPTSVFSSYYVPAGPTNEPQPVLYDPVLNSTFPLNLTNPSSIPTNDNDPVYYPVPLTSLSNATSQMIVSDAMDQVMRIVHDNGTAAASNCSKCVAALAAGQVVARIAPSFLPAAMIQLCQATGFASNSSCQTTYEAGSFGATWTQVLAAADVTGLDGQYICNALSSTFCPAPPVQPVNVTFPKPRPSCTSPPPRSGKTVKVLHMSDLHLDPRYTVGSEGNCTSSLCCRPAAPPAAGATPVPISLPAPLFGYYKCDSPYYLAMAALQAIGPLTNTSLSNPPAMTLYTGDLVSHDPENEMSLEYVESIELAIWDMFKAYIGGPVYCALGNHDSSPENQDAPHAIDNNGTLGQQFSWNYNHVSKLWNHFGWIDNGTAANASLHYGAYSIVSPLGVRIITINTDFYYKSNYYAFIHAANPDYSGMFTFLISELQLAEDLGQRVWIVGHVLSGWDGSNPLPNGADMFYQIVERYSPHVIANIFFGHTHEDQAFIYYNNNGTNQTAANALVNAWVGPSITPLTNLNSGFRMYEVDTESFEVFEAYTFYGDVNSFGALNGTGPTWQFEYSTRATYAPHIAGGWPADAPLNATFWHHLTEAMANDSSNAIVSQMNTFQGKSSVKSPNCTSNACAQAKVCYMRSGSVGLGRQCPQGFASVQSPYTGKNF